MDYAIPLSDQTVDKIKSSATNDQELLSMLERDILSEPSCLLGPLDAYRSDVGRGSIMDDSIKIQPDGISLESDLTGSVIFEFDEDIYYGCKDMDGLEEHYEGIDFSIDLIGKKLILHAADLQIREDEL